MRLLTLTKLFLTLTAGAVLTAPLAPAAGAQSEPTPTSEAAFNVAADRIIAMMEATSAVPGASPASAVVMVRRGQPPRIWVQGRLARDRAGVADADTAFYIASQTKSFVGLMASDLDERGVFDLDQTMAAVWPDLVLPRGADPATITFRQLLSHQAPIENDALSFRTSYTDHVPAADYGRLLAHGSRARSPGYKYSNLGYLIYAAALELKTGRDWRDWIDEVLFRPTGMTGSGPWSSRMNSDDLPGYHRWSGGNDWNIQSVKPDDLMHAAGGLNLTPNDMARWLALQLGGGGLAQLEAAVGASHVVQVRAAIRNDAIPCQGYTVGWMSCRIGAVDALFHGGNYTGVRSSMIVSPELGVGIAFMSNSDSLTGGTGQRIVKAFLEGVQDPGDLPAAAEFGADYARRLQRALPQLIELRTGDRGARRWQGWAWRPESRDRAPYVGRYAHPALGNLEVVETGQGLELRMGMLRRPLQPARLDLFAMLDGPVDPLDPIEFTRRAGQAAMLEWRGNRFERTD